MDRFTRKDYMGSWQGQDNWREVMTTNHRRFYAQLVNDTTINRVVTCVGRDRLLQSSDPHLNDIPLRIWDSIATQLPLACKFTDLDDHPSLTGLVCVAKEAARQWLETTRSHVGTDA